MCGLGAQWTEDHVQEPAFHGRWFFDLGKFTHLFTYPLQQISANFRMGVLSPTEHDREFDLVAFFQEALSSSHFER